MLKRIFVSAFISIIILLASLGLISYQRVQESITKSYEERLAAAEMIASHIDNLLTNHLTRLFDISLSGKIDFKDGDWKPERSALKDAYAYSIFTDGIFLTDLYGTVVQTYPSREGGRINLRQHSRREQGHLEMKPMISNVYTMEPIKEKSHVRHRPFKNRFGNVVGVAGGEINPANYLIAQSIVCTPKEKDRYRTRRYSRLRHRIEQSRADVRPCRS